MANFPLSEKNIPVFKRNFFTGTESVTRIGHGKIGGKATGLVSLISELNHFSSESVFKNLTVEIPRFTVITTHYFDRFMEQNDLYEFACSDEPDERIVHHFLQGNFPADLTGDLWALIAKVHTPLAVRSSSLLEDSLQTPFAGIYETKMIPNNQPDVESRFQKLSEAIKYVYASTFFKRAKTYAKATGHPIEKEKMAVMIQEVAGLMHGRRYYPNISGVARSYNFYPFGNADPENGVVSLALGLGKTIVDGGLSWTYSPVYPCGNPPFGSTGELIKYTQTGFWAVNMESSGIHDPMKETEYLIHLNINDADYDNVLKDIASTYDAGSDRLVIGTGITGTRVLTFAPILQLGDVPVNEILKTLMTVCEASASGKIEMEFAVTIDPLKRQTNRFYLLQVRRMIDFFSHQVIDLDTIDSSRIVIRSDLVQGDGMREDIQDVVYLKPDRFDFKYSQMIPSELEKINQVLVSENRSYLLIGYGRWGSSDPWLGVPVQWDQISGAKIIVETDHPDRKIDFSQGSHFFHNICNHNVMVFAVKEREPCLIDWKWLQSQAIVCETEWIKHVRLKSSLRSMVSAKQRMGVILK